MSTSLPVIESWNVFLSSTKTFMIGSVTRAHERILGAGRALFKGCIEERVALAVQLGMESELVRVLRLFQQRIAMGSGDVRGFDLGPLPRLHASGYK